ncbi:MAG: alanine dehydrogenase [Gammaproteobacteria bacterium]|nr:alanine dehydrogenase [Gammaproteobacteria bacterium]
MHIGIPKEVKLLEGRVALIPEAASELVRAGHRVFVQSSAGVDSGYSDEAYQAVGVSLVKDAQTLYANAQMVIKVKEPQPEEWPLLRRDHLLFCYLHLAAEPLLLKQLLNIGVTGVAFETVTEGDKLPLLAPMSDIAGRIAAQAGCHYLHRSLGGKGILMGGLTATCRGRAVILGAGVAGESACLLLASLGADVIVFDKNLSKLAAIRKIGANVTALYPYQTALGEAVKKADLLIGAILIPGAKAPYVVTREMVKSMEPGSVVIDISVDQGGCIETTRPTNYKDPTYLWEGIIHFAVTNMPSAVARMASQVLAASILPYALDLAEAGWEKHPALKAGINVRNGEIVLPYLRSV